MIDCHKKSQNFCFILTKIPVCHFLVEKIFQLSGSNFEFFYDNVSCFLLKKLLNFNPIIEKSSRVKNDKQDFLLK